MAKLGKAVKVLKVAKAMKGPWKVGTTGGAKGRPKKDKMGLGGMKPMKASWE
jgi:hypothetical protein